MKINSHKTHQGFTLIEMMAVIAIIVILAGVVIGSMNYVADKQAREKAKVQVSLLEKALEDYKMDMGRYPGDDDNTAIDGDVSEQLYVALFYEGYDYSQQATPPAPGSWTKSVGATTVMKATKIYLPELDPTSSKQGWVKPVTTGTPPASTKIMDPWGGNYRYRKGTNAQNPGFDLWTMGKDGKSDTANPAITQKENKDDIRNF